MQDRINEYPIIRDLIKDMGFTLECGPNVDEVCFTDGMRGYVYLKYYHHRVLACTYRNPSIETEIRCDTKKTGEKMSIRARALRSGDCLLEFFTEKGKVQIISPNRVTSERVYQFNKAIEEEQAK